MANPIKASDLYEDSGELKKLIAELERVQEELKNLKDVQVDSANELNKTLKKVNATTAVQRESIEASAKQADEIAKRYQKYNDSLGKNAVKIAALKEAQRELNNTNKLEAKILEAKEGSYNQLSAQYSLNKIRLNKLSEEERKNTKAGKELVKVTNDIYQEMKVLQEETGKTSLNVGNYKEAIEQADTASGGLIGGVRNIGKSFKVLLANPVVLFLTLIVGALSALGNAFRSSDKGARLLEKGTAVLSALFSTLVQLSVTVAETIQSAFEDPVQAVKDLGSAIVTNLVNRIKGFGILMFETGTIIKETLTLNFDEATEAAKRAGQAAAQIATGLDTEQQKAALEVFDNIKTTIEETVDASLELNAARLAISRSNRAIQKSVEDLTTQEAVLQSTADDTTKSFKEREEAAAAARSVLEEKNKQEIQIARNNLSLINQEIAIRRKSGEDAEQLLDGQLSAYQALRQAERDYSLSVIGNERTINELKQDRLERDLDILIDGFDNQKTINEKLVADDTLTFEKRKSILDETNKLSDDSFAKQIETIQQFTGIAVNSSELIGETDAVVLNEKIRSLGLSEIIEGRLLEIIRDRKSANQDLAESEKALAAAVEKSAANQLKYRQGLIAKSKKIFADFKKALEVAAEERFKQQQAFNESEFDLLETNEDEKTKFALEQEKERIQRILDLKKQNGEDLTELEVATFKNIIAGIDKEIEGLGKGENKDKDIYDILGLKLDDEGKAALNESLSFIKNQFSELAAARVEFAKQNVDAANAEIAASQNQLQIEIANRNAGYADKVETAQKELAAAKRAQEEALKEQEKAQRAQQRIQTIEQSVSLVTAAANIFKDLPIFLAIPAVALMFGSFAAAKIKSAQLTKKKFADGGLEVLGGGSHASGNDTYLGFQSEGKAAYGEAGEAVAIIPKGNTRKYKTVLPDLVDSLRKGTFEKKYQKINSSYSSDGSDIFIQGQAASGLTDVSRMENDLSAIRKNGERMYSTNSKGQQVIKYKNLTRTYV